MKKAFALVLTIALIAALAVVSFAASPVGSQEDILTGLYVSGKDYDTAVYSLVVTWDAENTFSWIPNKATWNPDVQQYVGDGTGVWADESFTVSVVNHSNNAVNASVAVKNHMDGVTLLLMVKASVILPPLPKALLTMQPPSFPLIWLLLVFPQALIWTERRLLPLR